MQHDIAFLHTSPVHVPTFERLVQAAFPGLRVRHMVAEDLLAEAQSSGANSPRLVERVQQAMKDATSSGAVVAVCTCSTIGGAAERTPTNGAFIAARIDRAMADRAVSLGPRVLIVAALESTLAPTTALIHESAERLAREVDVRQSLVPGAWEHFRQGNVSAYIEAIAKNVSAMKFDFDVVVLAQASMAPTVETLSGIGCEVLASPTLGVQRVIEDFARRRARP